MDHLSGGAFPRVEHSGTVSRAMGSVHEVVMDLCRAFASYVFSTATLVFIATAFMFSAGAVYARVINPSPLGLRLRVLLRGFAIFTIGRCLASMPTLLSTSPGSPEAEEILAMALMTFSASAFVEVISCSLQSIGVDFDACLSVFELTVLIRDYRHLAHPSQAVVSLLLLSFSAQILVHLESIFGTHRFTLLRSSIVGLLHLCWFVVACAQGSLFDTSSLAVFGILRCAPQLAMLCMIVCCWSIYGLAALIVGRENLKVHNTFTGLNPQQSRTFFVFLMTQSLSILLSLCSAGSYSKGIAVYVPLSAWFEDSDLPGPGAANPYGVQVTDAPRTRAANPTAAERCPVLAARPLIARLMASVQIAGALCGLVWHWLVCRKRGKPTEQQLINPDALLQSRLQSVVSLLTFGAIDKEPTAYAALLCGKPIPEVDDSPDYVPPEDDDDVSDNESDDSEGNQDNIASDNDDDLNDDDLTEDRAFCLESLTEQASSPSGLVSLLTHLGCSHLLTRQGYFSLVNREEELRQFILERRSNPARLKPAEANALCVVCMASPRQIILWPCRCLALCEECRMTLELRGFRQCSCCRQPVTAYSRIYTP